MYKLSAEVLRLNINNQANKKKLIFIPLPTSYMHYLPTSLAYFNLIAMCDIIPDPCLYAAHSYTGVPGMSIRKTDT